MRNTKNQNNMYEVTRDLQTPQIWIVFHTPCTWNYYPRHLSIRIDDLRLFCVLAQALIPLETIATCNLSGAIYM